MSGFHGKGEDFPAAVETTSLGKAGICTQAKTDLAVCQMETVSEIFVKGIFLNWSEKHPHLLLCLRGASKLFNSSLLFVSRSSRARQVSVLAPVVLQGTPKHRLPPSS